VAFRRSLDAMSDQPTSPGQGTEWWSAPVGDVSSGPEPTTSGESAPVGLPAPAAEGSSVPLGPEFEPVAAPPPVRTGRARLVATMTAVTLLAGLIGGAVGATLSKAASDADVHRPVDLGQTVSRPPLARAPGSVSAIATKVLPSVVSINVRGGASGDTGSGVILSPDGYILTNNHVVSAAADGGVITVVFYAKQSVAAKIVGTDPKSDLAVIRAQGVSGLRRADLGSSATLQVGDPVVAIGSPLGLTGTVTAGIVSAKDRPVPTGGEGTSQQVVIDAIQTDAAINPGNSGGALVDGSGALVGINSAIATLGGNALGGQGGNIGVGFAIPIDQARSIAGELISTGHATHPVIGVSAQSIDAELARSIPGGRPGAQVVRTTRGGGAEKAGIKKDDILTAVDGQPIASVDELIVAVRKHRVGEQAKVTFVRNGKEHRVAVTLGDSG
jgi:putative serine protease PepD